MTLVTPFRLLFLLAVVGYFLSVRVLSEHRHKDISDELRVALPRFVQVLMTGGDRFLAANVSSIRAIIAAPEKMAADDFHIQARLQQDAAWFNPSHEDNYYVAAAILPWYNELDAAQAVLQRASDARRFDFQPPFYYAFNLYHFKRDPAAAAEVLVKAAPHIRSENNRITMENLAIVWTERGYEPSRALRIVEASAASARSGGFKSYLLLRAKRLRGLLALQAAAEKFKRERQRPLRDINELVQAGFIDSLPQDPFGFGYGLDENGVPILLSTLRK